MKTAPPMNTFDFFKYFFGSFQSHTIWSQVVMWVAGLLELKTLS